MTTAIQPTVLHRNASSDGRRVWEIRRSNRDGVVYCTCPSWRFSKRIGQAKNCKHLTAFFAGYEQVAA